MSTHDDDSLLDKYLEGNSELSASYRELPGSQPPMHLDARILGAARARAASTGAQRSWLGRGRRWGWPVSAMALIVLSVSLVVMVEPGVEAPLLEVQPQATVERSREGATDDMAPLEKPIELDSLQLESLEAAPAEAVAPRATRETDPQRSAPEPEPEARPAAQPSASPRALPVSPPAPQPEPAPASPASAPAAQLVPRLRTLQDAAPPRPAQTPATPTSKARAERQQQALRESVQQRLEAARGEEKAARQSGKDEAARSRAMNQASKRLSGRIAPLTSSGQRTNGGAAAPAAALKAAPQSAPAPDTMQRRLAPAAPRDADSPSEARAAGDERRMDTQSAATQAEDLASALERIRKLLDSGDLRGAARALAELRSAHPGAEIPEDIRARLPTLLPARPPSSGRD